MMNFLARIFHIILLPKLKSDFALRKKKKMHDEKTNLLKCAWSSFMLAWTDD